MSGESLRLMTRFACSAVTVVSSGGYVALTVIWRTGSFALAVVLGALTISLVGIAEWNAFLKRLSGQELGQVLTTMGFALIFQDLALVLWGGDPHTITVPAALSVSEDPFIVYSSNVFAILGLRALYLLLAETIAEMRYLHVGLAAVLGYYAFVSVPDLRARTAAMKWYPSNFAGWDVLADGVREVRDGMPEGTRIVADNFKVGAELGFALDDAAIEVLEHPVNRQHGRAPQLRLWNLEATGAYTLRSEVTANRADPAMVGKWWLRVPRSRATLQASYRPSPAWMFSAGYRHEGRSYNDTYNLDIQPQVFGASSKVNQLDLRVTHKPVRHLELALGLDNVTDDHAYVFHPYPGRTLFFQVRTSSR